MMLMVKMSKDEKPEFTFEVVENKPEKKYRKGGSKYEPIINTFLEKSANDKTIVLKIRVKGKGSNYIRGQLKKIIDNDDLPLLASVVNDDVYLERKDRKITKKIN